MLGESEEARGQSIAPGQARANIASPRPSNADSPGLTRCQSPWLLRRLSLSTLPALPSSLLHACMPRCPLSAALLKLSSRERPSPCRSVALVGCMKFGRHTAYRCVLCLCAHRVPSSVHPMSLHMSSPSLSSRCSRVKVSKARPGSCLAATCTTRASSYPCISFLPPTPLSSSCPGPLSVPSLVLQATRPSPPEPILEHANHLTTSLSLLLDYHHTTIQFVQVRKIALSRPRYIVPC